VHEVPRVGVRERLWGLNDPVQVAVEQLLPEVLECVMGWYNHRVRRMECRMVLA